MDREVEVAVGVPRVVVCEVVIDVEVVVGVPRVVDAVVVCEVVVGVP